MSLFTSTPWCTVTDHPNYIVVKPLFNLKPKSTKPKNPISRQKLNIEIRNKRLREIGYSYDGWKTFITLTFAPYYYGTTFKTTADYYEIQKKFRFFVKYIKRFNPDFIYLAVLEHGGKYGRLHYHMLTNLDFDSNYFQKFKHPTKKIFPQWKYGFSDVVKMYNPKGAVGYILKYVGKNGSRTPIGKREIFHSNEIGKVTKKNMSYNEFYELVDNKELKYYDFHHNCEVYLK